ncbi:Uncharacterized protein M6B38_228125 [Iris pallida]|uniref:DUF1997 family protein n=1 Tax=Iris pallida TaxID=29817 RepID=A0AAX6DT56_IRIPA|nr:Uncharacterized protein M6B38_228125 [Iris pallida]
MITQTPPPPLPPVSPSWATTSRRKWEVIITGSAGKDSSSRKANLHAKRKERVMLPVHTSGHGRAPLHISEFLNHPSGVESLLNTRTLQSFQPIDSNTYRCNLHPIQFLKFEVAPVLELQVIPTREDCTVEMLSCKFVGTETLEQQNQLFSAFMRNHITWEMDDSGPYLEVDVTLRIALEVFTKPFSMLPLSVVEKPGNLVMQSLLDRLVPLLAEQLLKDYDVWVEEQLQFSSKN